MNLVPLEIDGSWLFRSPVYGDDRGSFREWFKSSDIEAETKIKFSIAQANVSTSAKGVIRGIHYSLAVIGQAKWITCQAGRMNDVIVDIRPDSPTFGHNQIIELTPQNGLSIYIGEGLGHGFISLEDNTVVSYLVSSPFSPKEEFEINPLDPALGIAWGIPNEFLKVSAKDAAAPNLEAQKGAGKLPFLSKEEIDYA
jgi:dTDP-4-dehydrorhamnose 3,5-epimerase